jgi:hypothetical protein
LTLVRAPLRLVGDKLAGLGARGKAVKIGHGPATVKRLLQPQVRTPAQTAAG